MWPIVKRRDVPAGGAGGAGAAAAAAHGGGFTVPTPVARARFFLSTRDLQALPSESVSFGFGTGRARVFFREGDLHAAALRRFGEAALAEKHARRVAREERKRARESDADVAQQELLAKRRALQTADGAARSPAAAGAAGAAAGAAAAAAAAGALSPPPPQVAAVLARDWDAVDDPVQLRAALKVMVASASAPAAPAGAGVAADLERTIANVRKSLAMQIKRKVNCDHRGRPASFRIEVPGIPQAVFAALAEIPDDPELKTLVKHGGYYNAYVRASSVMGVSRRTTTRRIFDIYMVVGSHCDLKYRTASQLLSVAGHSCNADWDAEFTSGSSD